MDIRTSNVCPARAAKQQGNNSFIVIHVSVICSYSTGRERPSKVISFLFAKMSKRADFSLPLLMILFSVIFAANAEGNASGIQLRYTKGLLKEVVCKIGTEKKMDSMQSLTLFGSKPCGNSSEFYEMAFHDIWSTLPRLVRQYFQHSEAFYKWSYK
ncbi:macrophage mannose receptor 1 [Plakobranchus ocellatus]|uniref:Macrophage mannose receptor 1 n=1 Tax=Plakobranchus ocellatus TaxID=259542 RepID=A0AAV4AMG4_9GAST|nr:macrophage mannose receptor 1 [Plakobranchus ocellatus]